jgi:multidrug efflux pump subunit AcrA (membrane-fusion protein)
MILIAAITGGLMGGVIVPQFINNTDSEAAAEIAGEVTSVERGNIIIDIASAGNLSYSVQEDLAFGMAGTVEEVMVEVGDSVTEGQVLARLDSSEWDDELKTRENSLLQAEINLKSAEVAYDNAVNPYTEEDIEEVEDELNQAISQLNYSLKHGPESSVLQDQETVYQLQKQLDEMEEGGDPDDIEIKGMQLELAQAQLENALTDLSEALDSSLEVVAPFDGFVTAVSVEGGDEVFKGTVAVQIADPTRFEVELLVNETDIYDVVVGAEATVQVDAMDALSLLAQVTYISPTATIQSGVVSYEVTVEAESLDTIREQQQEALQERQEAMQEALAFGELPERLQEAVEQRQMTQEQAEAMVREFQQTDTTALEQIPMLIPEDLELREGLSVTASILIEEALDVVMVPNQAIIYQGREAYVQVVTVMTEDTTMVEERLVETGLSDWQYTEITDGLTEGEEVVVPEGAVVTTTTTQQESERPPGMMPGMGMGGRPQ